MIITSDFAEMPTFTFAAATNITATKPNEGNSHGKRLLSKKQVAILVCQTTSCDNAQANKIIIGEFGSLKPKRQWAIAFDCSAEEAREMIFLDYHQY